MKEVINMSNNDQEFLVQKIRTQYTEKQHTELDALKELDTRVKRPANVFAYIYGSVSAVVMGAGMSLVMTEIGEIIGLASAMIPGIAIGVVGMGMALSTYPIYKKILSGRKKKYAPEILKLSEKIMKGEHERERTSRFSAFKNTTLCFAGGILFGVGRDAFSNRILNKTSLVYKMSAAFVTGGAYFVKKTFFENGVRV